jgi:UMF1 family MFS transporter
MFYDFANSAFTTVIVSVVYNFYFKQQVAGGQAGYGEHLWGLAVGLSMTMVALTAPFLGAVADFSRSKKKMLFIFTYMTIVFTGLLYFVGKGDVFTGILFFILANYSFNSGNVFYDAFLPELSTPRDIGKVSGYGWAFGYVGGLVSLLLSLLLVKFNVRYVFPMISLHFLVFSLVTFILLKEVHRPSKRTNYLRVARDRIAFSLKNIYRLPQLLRYILSYFVYNDGITTVIVFATPYGMERFGMSVQDMILYFILAQFTSILGAAAFGWLTDRLNVKTSLSLSLLIWIGVVVWAFFCQSATEYYFVGLTAGLAIGSSQSNSRTMLSLLTPKSRQAEFFGFYTLTGRLSSIIGPILYGWIALRTGNLRLAILSLMAFFVLGWILLQSVSVSRGIRQSEALNEA